MDTEDRLCPCFLSYSWFVDLLIHSQDVYTTQAHVHQRVSAALHQTVEATDDELSEWRNSDSFCLILNFNMMKKKKLFMEELYSTVIWFCSGSSPSFYMSMWKTQIRDLLTALSSECTKTCFQQDSFSKRCCKMSRFLIVVTPK